MAHALILPPAVGEHPASARLVYAALDTAETSLTVEELVDRTNTPFPTVKQAIARLQRDALIEGSLHALDARRKVWTTSTPDARREQDAANMAESYPRALNTCRNGRVEQ